MGLTANSTGLNAVDFGLVIKKINDNDKVIALAGNPNVGKSTVFNELTGLKQHTGNWAGKTVTNAQGVCNYNNTNYILVDIPGTYSLMAHSAEEEVARDFICFGNPDAVIVVCDATCLERNLNLVLQTIEITDNVVVCVNLMDEAKNKGIEIDLKELSIKLGVPVVGTSARSGKGLNEMMNMLETVGNNHPISIKYIKSIEEAIALVEPVIKEKIGDCTIHSRWIALKLIDYDTALISSLSSYLGLDLLEDNEIAKSLHKAREIISQNNITDEGLKDKIVSCIVLTAEEICMDIVRFDRKCYNANDRKIDKILTNKWTGFPIMIALLGLVFWITITGANYPSALLSDGLFWLEDRLVELCILIRVPKFIYEMLIFGAYRVLAWVVSVMLPPMAIFFPLFTLLEDLGYLPRVAFNLDKSFKKCCACGKQALTMVMGFGCNAAGIVGCRIIDSPRERLIAMITNNFVPCNGRFPTLIAIITMFFVGTTGGLVQSLVSTMLLTVVILLGIFMTFAISALLSKTILKGEASAFTLELPPYRKPKILEIIVRSVFDRTLFVLGRAIAISAPAGLVIWILANISIGNYTLLAHCSNFLNPFAQALGMDGVILLAFILGFPANEIVIPIIIMSYMATGSIMKLDSLFELRQLLVNNGWTWITAISTMLFSLMHFPCSTTCLTIKKETQSNKWTAISFLVPTVTGIIICFLFANIARLFI